MTNKDINAVARLVLPSLPGFSIKAPLMVLPPLTHALRAICFEGHSHDARLFYVWGFVLPLCVPTNQISFNLGKRIVNATATPWNLDAPNLVKELSASLVREALPVLSQIESPLDFARAAQTLGNARDPYAQQATAYALVVAGEILSAIEALNKLASMLDHKILWQREMLERANSLLAMIPENVHQAQRQLAAWAQESIRNLKLEKFC